jgi:hypothetical protein
MSSLPSQRARAASRDRRRFVTNRRAERGTSSRRPETPTGVEPTCSPSLGYVALPNISAGLPLASRRGAGKRPEVRPDTTQGP